MSEALGAIIIGLFNLIGIGLSFWLNHRQIKKIEKNTNSMSERLEKASFLSGKAEGKEEQKISDGNNK